MKKKLTPKQEEFTLLYFKLGNATEAYKQSSYSSDNMKEATITRNAHTLLSNNNILAMLDDLKQAAAKKVIITRDQVLGLLVSIGAQGEKDSDRVSALKQVCKMMGWEAPTKQEITMMDTPELILSRMSKHVKSD